MKPRKSARGGKPGKRSSAPAPRSRPTRPRPAAPGPRRAAPGPKRAFSVFHGEVLRGGDPALSGWVASLFDIDERLTRALTHGFHPYAARLHPGMARAVVQRFSRLGDTVLDPFSGSGTVLVEALIAGRRGIGVDASPLAVELARVKTEPLDAHRRALLCEVANGIAEASAEIALKRQRPPAIPAWSREADMIFAPHVFLELLGLRALVMEAFADDKAMARALRLSLSSILGKFVDTQAAERTRQGRGGGELPPARKRIARGLPSEFFARRVHELAEGLAALEKACKGQREAPFIVQGDARDLGEVAPTAGVSLVVSSPPYAGTYDYVDLHAFRYPWLNLPAASARQRQIGQPTRGIGADPKQWPIARRAFLAEIARVLAPGGHALLVVGDGVVGERAEDALQGTADTALSLGLEALAWASQEREIRDRRLAAIFARQPRREHLLLLAKPADGATRPKAGKLRT